MSDFSDTDSTMGAGIAIGISVGVALGARNVIECLPNARPQRLRVVE